MLSVNEQLEITGLSKGAYYYKPVDCYAQDEELMKAMDQEHIEHPNKGTIGLQDAMLLLGFVVGRRKIKRLMGVMNIHAVYPKPSLSKLGKPAYKMPYLLRGLKVDHANQVWSTDISYIPMAKGFLYLYAIIDVYSRYIVGWGLYSSLEAVNAIEVLNWAVEHHGKPEIINTDQGSQYTCEEWHKACKDHAITMSMDGRARYLDNIWIERFWRTIKQEYVYLNPCDTAVELREGISRYIAYYNNKRAHQGLDHRRPCELYRTMQNQAA